MLKLLILILINSTHKNNMATCSKNKNNEALYLLISQVFRSITQNMQADMLKIGLIKNKLKGHEK